jgi:DDE domain
MSKVRNSLYRGHRFPADVIAHAAWLYFRFPLSLRMVEDLPAARGSIVSHETVRRWAEKFGRDCNEIRRRARQFGAKWRLDEAVITINGVKRWLWRAVDQEGFVFDALVRQPVEIAMDKQAGGRAGSEKGEVVAIGRRGDRDETRALGSRMSNCIATDVPKETPATQQAREVGWATSPDRSRQ